MGAVQQLSRSLKKDERIGAYAKTTAKVKADMPGYLIKLMAPANDAKAAGAMLSAILGFHQINPNEFCTQFNKLSEHMIEFLPIPVLIFKKDKTFSLKLKEPTLETLLFNALITNPPETIETQGEEYWQIKKGLSRCLLFDIILMKRFFFSKTAYTSAKIVFGTLRSFKSSRSNFIIRYTF